MCCPLPACTPAGWPCPRLLPCVREYSRSALCSPPPSTPDSTHPRITITTTAAAFHVSGSPSTAGELLFALSRHQALLRRARRGADGDRDSVQARSISSRFRRQTCFRASPPPGKSSHAPPLPAHRCRLFPTRLRPARSEHLVFRAQLPSASNSHSSVSLSMQVADSHPPTAPATRYQMTSNHLLRHLLCTIFEGPVHAKRNCSAEHAAPLTSTKRPITIARVNQALPRDNASWSLAR